MSLSGWYFLVLIFHSPNLGKTTKNRDNSSSQRWLHFLILLTYIYQILFEGLSDLMVGSEEPRLVTYCSYLQRGHSHWQKETKLLENVVSVITE